MNNNTYYHEYCPEYLSTVTIWERFGPWELYNSNIQRAVLTTINNPRFKKSENSTITNLKAPQIVFLVAKDYFMHKTPMDILKHYLENQVKIHFNWEKNIYSTYLFCSSTSSFLSIMATTACFNSSEIVLIFNTLKPI